MSFRASSLNVCIVTATSPTMSQLACVTLYGKWVLWCEQFQPIRLLRDDGGGVGVCLEDAGWPVWVGFSGGGTNRAGCCLKMNDMLLC